MRSPGKPRKQRSKYSQVTENSVELAPQMKIRKVILAIITGVLPDDLRTEALRLLIETLRASDDDIRSLAVIGLHEIGIGSPAALDAFTDAMNDPCLPVRRRAIRAIGDFGPAAEHVVRELISAVNDGEHSIRIEAINAIGKMGGAAKAAIPAVVSLLGDEDTRIRTIAGLALRKIGPQAVPHLIGLLSDPDAICREHAAHLLGKFGSSNDTVIGALLEASADFDGDVRTAARESLDLLQRPYAV